MKTYSMSMFLNKAALEKARAEDTMSSIREVSKLLYNGYGDDITPEEQIDMIEKIIAHHRGK